MYLCTGSRSRILLVPGYALNSFGPIHFVLEHFRLVMKFAGHHVGYHDVGYRDLFCDLFKLKRPRCCWWSACPKARPSDGEEAGEQLELGGSDRCTAAQLLRLAHKTHVWLFSCVTLVWLVSGMCYQMTPQNGSIEMMHSHTNCIFVLLSPLCILNAL